MEENSSVEGWFKLPNQGVFMNLNYPQVSSWTSHSNITTWLAMLEWEAHEDTCANCSPISFWLPNQKKASNFHTANVVFTLSKVAGWIFFTENGDEHLLACQSSETERFNKKNLYAPINRAVKASSLRAAYGDIILMITEQKLLHALETFSS